MADFAVGMLAAPSHFLCNMINECISIKKQVYLWYIYIFVFTLYASGTNLFSLVLERYIAVVKPLKYLTFMTSRRVTQMVLTSWAIPFLFAISVFVMRFNSFHCLSAYYCLSFEIILCVIFIFSVASMYLVQFTRTLKIVFHPSKCS